MDFTDVRFDGESEYDGKGDSNFSDVEEFVDAMRKTVVNVGLFAVSEQPSTFAGGGSSGAHYVDLEHP